MNEVLDATVKKHRGSVRGLGFGALPSKVDVQVHQNEHVTKLKGKVLDLEQQLDEIRAMLIKERRQNDVKGKAKHDNIMFDDLIQVNEVGSVTESIEAVKISKRVGSSIANLLTGLDTGSK
ncbi:unnamed protein product [Camellia sinensis]